MPAKKGTRPPGRKRGVPNKVTASAREIFAAFLDCNAAKAQGWIDRVAKHNPKGALELLVKVAEFCLPKLQRTEVVDPGRALPPPLINISFPNGGPGQPSAAMKQEADASFAQLAEVDPICMRALAPTESEEE